MGYLPALDGLRGISILLVMLYHASLLEGGALGVDVFFVLSGFLITSILIEEWDRKQDLSLRRFYVRRVLRLMPALMLCIATILIAQTLWSPSTLRHLGASSVVSSLAYVFNWTIILDHDRYAPVTHFWSLSIEEQFYLVWPLALLFLLRRRVSRPSLIRITIAATLFAAYLRLLLYREYDPVATDRCYFGSDTRSDALWIGCALAFAQTSGHQLIAPRFRFLALTSALCVLGLSVLTSAPFLVGEEGSPELYRGQFTIFAVAVAVVISQAVDGGSPRLVGLLSRRPLVWLGKLSYSLYLFHFPAYYYVRELYGPTWSTLEVFATMNGLAFALAMASYYGVERPLNRLKHRVAP